MTKYCCCCCCLFLPQNTNTTSCWSCCASLFLLSREEVRSLLSFAVDGNVGVELVRELRERKGAEPDAEDVAFSGEDDDVARRERF